MALGTRGGNLLLKDARLQTGCACCGEQPCGCGPQEQVRPESLTIEFEGFAFSPVDSPFNSPGSAENQGAAITSYVAGLGPIVLPLFESGGLGYVYGTLGCSTKQVGEPTFQFRDVGCSSCPPDFYANEPTGVVPEGRPEDGAPSSPSLRVFLDCNGGLDRRRSFSPGLPEQWRFWRPLIATGNIAAPTWVPSACGGDAMWEFTVTFPDPANPLQTLPLSVTPPCEGQFDEVEVNANIPATVSALAGDNSFWNYLAVGGTVRITPNYGNPLP